MTPAARREFNRLNEQDDRDTRIIKRAVERQTIAYLEEISRLKAERSDLMLKIQGLTTELELTAAELGRMRFAAISAGAEV